MAHSAVADPPTSNTTAVSDFSAHVAVTEDFGLPVRARVGAGQGPLPDQYPPKPTSAGTGAFLSDVLLENHHLENSRQSKLLDLFVVILLHVTLVGGPILAGLYFTDTLNLKQYTATLLVAPPPPPPPPPAPAVAVRAVAPKRVFMNEGKLLAPTVIPQRVVQIKEAPIEPDAFGVAGGVPGGVPGGQMGGVIGGIIGGTSTVAAAPPLVQSRVPIRVGGKIKPPRAISTPPPKYPVIARQSRMQGVVLIDAVIDTDGGIAEMKVLSGHPMLIPAALEAVKYWKYEPTYLNGEPIAVQLIVTVTFVLSRDQ